MSAMTPPVLVTGALPKKPEKKRVIRIVCMSLAVAVPNEKTAAMKYGWYSVSNVSGQKSFRSYGTHTTIITHFRP